MSQFFTLSSLFVFIFILSACTQSGQEDSKGKVSEYTAILNVLEATRKDVHAMHEDIASIKQEIAALKLNPPPTFPDAKPEPDIAELKYDLDDPVMGSDTATVAIVEFSDYECPFCAKFNSSSFPQIKQNFIDTGKVKLVSLDFPLGFHPSAKSAAIAASCASRQKNYGAMRKTLFENQSQLNTALYEKTAEKLGLDMNLFKSCMKDDAVINEVQQDLDYATSLGVTGSPTFFIGVVQGNKIVKVKKLVGALPYASFEMLIKQYL